MKEGKRMEKRIDRARALLEALPYIQRFAGKTFVVKYGGAAMVEEQLKREFARDIVLLKYIGLNPVVVHGGGPQIGQQLKRIGIEPKFVSGLRITDSETLSVVEMVLRGMINPEIVGLINAAGGRAVGLCGKDGDLIRARKLKAKGTKPVSRKKVDLGWVGEVEEIHAHIIRTLGESGYIPVVAPIGSGKDGESYNLNADHLAGHLAAVLKAEKLIMLTDVEGIKDRRGKLMSSLSERKLKQAIAQGWISEGMIPKTQACLVALAGGAGKTHIVDGRVPHAILLELFTDIGIGTEVVR